MLKEKWWKQQKGGGQCHVATDSSAAALGLANVGGVFVVLVGGLLVQNSSNTLCLDNSKKLSCFIIETKDTLTVKRSSFFGKSHQNKMVECH